MKALFLAAAVLGMVATALVARGSRWERSEPYEGHSLQTTDSTSEVPLLAPEPPDETAAREGKALEASEPPNSPLQQLRKNLETTGPVGILLDDAEWDLLLEEVGLDLGYETFVDALDEHFATAAREEQDAFARELWEEPGAQLIFRDLTRARAMLRLVMDEDGPTLWHNFYPWDKSTCCTKHGPLWEDPVVRPVFECFEAKHMRFREMIPHRMREGGF